jgi:hypothetical protein
MEMELGGNFTVCNWKGVEMEFTLKRVREGFTVQLNGCREGIHIEMWNDEQILLTNWC